MKKTIDIDGRKVTFAIDGYTPGDYREMTGRDYFSDIQSIVKEGNSENIDSEIIYDITFLLAKTHDETLESKRVFFKSFDSFPLMDVLLELQPLIFANMQKQVEKVKKK